MSRAPPRYVLIGLPSILFSYLGFTTLTSFVEGSLSSRSLTRSTSKSEREARLETELSRAKQKAFRKEREGEYSFGKRIER
ncbi:hypothetical protein TeGR_g6963 [Tetraparma gracilis]|uniref:Uncharacterized protein n=1 Tax=Tetraparma gracilis TaxID=2962635 RepID=A0ABQ6N180_9STRA|nr:hypothetical protein TeGR_g6963 [Tetraparma gracilis]